MPFVWIMISLSLFSCKFFDQEKQEKFTPFYDSVYVSELTGVNFYPEKNKSSIPASIPYRTALTLTQLEEGDIWRKTSYSGKSGWILYNSNLFSNHQPDPKYFQVVAKTGLNLRESPSIDSKVKLLLPEEATGEIIEGFGIPIQIQNRLGIWLKVKYEKKEGWIFSGFVKIFDSFDSINQKKLNGSDYYFSIYEKPYQLSSIDFNENDLDLKRAKITKYEKKYYTILNIDYQVTETERDNCQIATFHRLIFQNKSTGKYYETGTYHSEYLKTLDNPFPETLTSTWYGCWCCCPWIGNNLYFLLEDKVLMIGYEEKETNAFCSRANVYISQPESLKRYDSVSRRLYQFIKYPDCDNPPEDLALDSENIGSYSWAPEKFPTQLFLILDFKGDKLEINRFLNKGIPKEYLEVWNNTPQIPKGN